MIDRPEYLAGCPTIIPPQRTVLQDAGLHEPSRWADWHEPIDSMSISTPHTTHATSTVLSVNEQLTQRQKLTTVLAHIENASEEDAGKMVALVAWLRRRIQQIDAAISPLFLDIPSDVASWIFAEVRGDPKWEEKGRSRSGRPELKLWKFDEEKGTSDLKDCASLVNRGRTGARI